MYGLQKIDNYINYLKRTYYYQLTMEHEKSPLTQIDSFISENKIYRFASELQYITDETRKNELRQILNIMRASDKTNEEKKTEHSRKKIDDLFDKIQETAYKKTWGKLNLNQKRNRIIAYVNEISMDDNKKEELKAKLTNMINNKKLKQTLIEYNSKDGVISKIDLSKI